MFKIILIVIFSTTLIKLTVSESKCPADGWIYLNANKCILYSLKKFNFTDAKEFCRNNFDTNLMTITSRHENKQLSKLLYDELQFDEYFWMDGKVNDKVGNFSWLNPCQSTNYSNFHTNNHEFNVNGSQEYLVLSSALHENKHTKRKERGTWCSFSPSIMFFALCEYALPDNKKIECKTENEINFNQNEIDDKEIMKSEKILDSDRSFITITKTQAYLITGSTLMIILFIILIVILKSSCTSNSPQINPVSNSEMY